ncbi:MAG: HD domain-containing protein [Prevotella sp.]|nr:HD domain-containing protein [Prevotella sp.]
MDNNQTLFLVVGRSNGTTRRGAPYCTLKLKNEEQDTTIAVWDVSPNDDPKVGQIVSFINIQENDGKRSARKLDMTPGIMADESHPLYHLMPHPIKREQWDECIKHLLEFCNDPLLKDIINGYASTLFKPYLKKPAATNIHHAFPGGLLNHTYQMLHMLEGLYPCLPYQVKIERCIIAILFHDYGKVYEYKEDGETRDYKYLLGHIFISANRLYADLKEKNVPETEINHIVHIVLAHHGELEYGSPVKPCSQEAVIVNMLDNLSAKTDTIEYTGNMESSFALGTHVVK